MKQTNTTLNLLPVYAIFTLLLTIVACKKTVDPPTVTTKTNAQLLVGAKWKTSGAVLYKADGTTLTLPSNTNFSFLYLLDVTFNSTSDGAITGTAAESDFGTDMTWALNDPTLRVTFGANGTDGIVTGTITQLDDHSMVLSNVTQVKGNGSAYTISYNGQSYVKRDQTFMR